MVSNFTLPNQQGEEINFYNALDNTAKGMVIFVYPKANTAGCTKQACLFRDHYDEIKENGYDIVGVSKDKQATQATWKRSKNLPYDLLCDEDGEVLKQFGCLSGSSTSRSVFIVDRETRSFLLDRVKITPDESLDVVIKMIKGIPDLADKQGDEISEGDKSANESEEVEKKDVVEELSSKPPTTKKAKPKAKAKASATGSRSRLSPTEKKAAKEQDGATAQATEKKTTRRAAGAAAQRAASVDPAPVETRRGTSRTNATAAAAAPKKSTKRSEPTGGVDDTDGSPKKQRKTPATSASTEEEDEEVNINVTTKHDKRPPQQQRTASQPTPRTSSRVTRKGAAAEQAATKKETSKKETLESKLKPKKAAAGGGATSRSASVSSATKKGKKLN